MDVINATRIFIFTDTYGYLNKTTNKWTGMLGDLVDGRADTGGSAIFLTPERISQIEYIARTVDGTVKFIFRAPPLSNVANIYILPFDKIVWCCIGILLITCILVIFGISKVMISVHKNDCNIQVVRRTEDIFSDSLLLGIAAVCQMGFDWPMKILSGKISTVR